MKYTKLLILFFITNMFQCICSMQAPIRTSKRRAIDNASNADAQFPCSWPKCNWHFHTQDIPQAHIDMHNTCDGKIFRCSVPTCVYFARKKGHVTTHEKEEHGIRPQKKQKDVPAFTQVMIPAIVEPIIHIPDDPKVLTKQPNDLEPITSKLSMGSLLTVVKHVHATECAKKSSLNKTDAQISSRKKLALDQLFDNKLCSNCNNKFSSRRALISHLLNKHDAQW